MKIYLSDGGELTLGSEKSQTELQFSTLKYNPDNNLISQVETTLTMGEMWVQAPKYYHSSNFSIQTDGRAATVRGTVFGVRKDSASSVFTLAQGKIEISSKEPNQPMYLPGGSVPGFTKSGSVIMMEVPAGSGAISLAFSSMTGPANSATGASLEDAKKAQDILHETRLDSGYVPQIIEIGRKGADNHFFATLENNQANTVLLTASGGLIASGADSLTGVTLSFSDDRNIFSGALDIGVQICFDPTKTVPA